MLAFVLIEFASDRNYVTVRQWLFEHVLTAIKQNHNKQ